MVNENGLYKIGISKHPNKRRSQIENMSGIKTQLLHTFNTVSDARCCERVLHTLHGDYRECGEWFSKVDIDLVSVVCEYECNLDPKSKVVVDFKTGDNSWWEISFGEDANFSFIKKIGEKLTLEDFGKFKLVCEKLSFNQAIRFLDTLTLRGFIL